LESGLITVSRAAFQTIFPARFQLIAAMNPCPCGYAGDPYQNCRCTPEQVQRYRGKLSGPFMDRIDLQVEVPALTLEDLEQTKQEFGESSAQVRERVLRARERQLQRQGKGNADLSVSEFNSVCCLDGDAQALLQKLMQKFHFSARTYHRLLKVALTIADLKESEVVGVMELSEALLYRCLDKQKASQNSKSPL
jgi:magnesium chelatase family protein